MVSKKKMFLKSLLSPAVSKSPLGSSSSSLRIKSVFPSSTSSFGDILDLVIHQDGVALESYLRHSSKISRNHLLSSRRRGYCALHEAVLRGNTSILSMILPFYARSDLLDVPSVQGQTPLHLAAQTSLSATKILLEAGCNPIPVDAFGWSPLFTAASSRQYEIISYLVAHGVDPFIKSIDGRTARDYLLRQTDQTVEQKEQYVAVLALFD